VIPAKVSIFEVRHQVHYGIDCMRGPLRDKILTAQCKAHCYMYIKGVFTSHLTLILGPHAGTKKWWRKCFITATLVEFSGLLFITGIPLWIVYDVASNHCKWKLPISVLPSMHHL